MMFDGSKDIGPVKSNIVIRFFKRIGELNQLYLDRVTPYIAGRWVFVLMLSAAFVLRVIYLQGWYIITYGLGIYLLNLFIAFLTPKVNPTILEDSDEDGPSLPVKGNEEFRPFMRRLPEFKFWYSTLKAISIGMVCTCFDVFNIPVFWPILVMYFFILFAITMKRQIKHMVRYRYLPFSHGKAKYKGKDDSGRVVPQ